MHRKGLKEVTHATAQRRNVRRNEVRDSSLRFSLRRCAAAGEIFFEVLK